MRLRSSRERFWRLMKLLLSYTRNPSRLLGTDFTYMDNRIMSAPFWITLKLDPQKSRPSKSLIIRTCNMNPVERQGLISKRYKYMLQYKFLSLIIWEHRNQDKFIQTTYVLGASERIWISQHISWRIFNFDEKWIEEVVLWLFESLCVSIFTTIR